MEKISQDEKLFVLRFDPKEEVITGLAEFCRENKVSSAYFHGIGSCSSLILSYYDINDKKYKDSEIKENLEIASFSGNVSLGKEDLIVHAHGVFGDLSLKTRAGHVKEMVVSATCEIFLTAIDSQVKRVEDPETGLNLLT